MTFDEYLAAYANELEKARQRLAKETLLGHLDRLVLKVAFLFHLGAAKRPPGNAGKAVASLVAMLTNEMFAFSGSGRAHSMRPGITSGPSWRSTPRCTTSLTT